MMVPADGDLIFHIVPPRVCPALKGVIVRPWHLPSLKSIFSACIQDRGVDYEPCK